MFNDTTVSGQLLTEQQTENQFFIYIVLPNARKNVHIGIAICVDDKVTFKFTNVIKSIESEISDLEDLVEALHSIEEFCGILD